MHPANPLRQQLIRSLAEEGVTPRAVAFSDIELARRAAAEVSKRLGYSMDAMYLRGDNDADPDVQAALLAITLLRRLESVSA